MITESARELPFGRAPGLKWVDAVVGAVDGCADCAGCGAGGLARIKTALHVEAGKENRREFASPASGRDGAINLCSYPMSASSGFRRALTPMEVSTKEYPKLGLLRIAPTS
jgi:hypothetical protein